MKAITLTQPWATLVAIGAKRIETRSWNTQYRGPIAIHASMAFPGSAKDLCLSDPFRSALGWPPPPTPLTQDWLDEVAARTKALPRGAVIATAKLVHCLDTNLVSSFVQPFTEQEQAFGDYSSGRYAFLLDDVVSCDPIPAKGMLSLWDWKPIS